MQNSPLMHGRLIHSDLFTTTRSQQSSWAKLPLAFIRSLRFQQSVVSNVVSNNCLDQVIYKSGRHHHHHHDHHHDHAHHHHHHSTSWSSPSPSSPSSSSPPPPRPCSSSPPPLHFMITIITIITIIITTITTTTTTTTLIITTTTPLHDHHNHYHHHFHHHHHHHHHQHSTSWSPPPPHHHHHHHHHRRRHHRHHPGTTLQISVPTFLSNSVSNPKTLHHDAQLREARSKSAGDIHLAHPGMIKLVGCFPLLCCVVSAIFSEITSRVPFFGGWNRFKTALFLLIR